MKKKQREPEIIVTPDQLTEGYLEKIGAVAFSRSFQIIRILPSGNYVVVNPAAPVPDEANSNGE